MDAAEVKKMAKEFGADLVGIAPISRLQNLPPQRNPLSISDRTKAVVVIGYRILRGAMRGIEEGTNFGSTYGMFGNNWLEHEFLARTAYLLTSWLEEQGVEAIPLLPSTEGSGQNFPDYRVVAEAAGLGKVGKGGFFLTKEYGHRQRFAMILVDADLAGDPIQDIDFCNDCDACAKACPLQAMTVGSDGAVAIDLDLCSRCQNGASPKPSSCDKVDRYAAACGRACMIALADKITNKFTQPFRKRQAWSIGLRGDKKLDGEKVAFVGGVCPKQ
jgi:epoxyqueuosine reductase